MQTDPAPKKKAPNVLRRVSIVVDKTISTAFGKLGAFVADHPWKTIGASVLVCVLLAFGLINFDIETNSEKLFVPQDSQAFEDKDAIEPIFGSGPRRGFVYLRPKSGTNVFDKSALLFLADVADKIRATTNKFDGKTWTWSEMCATASAGCAGSFSGVLEAWGTNKTLLEADPDPAATLLRFDANSTEFHVSEWVGNYQLSNGVPIGTSLKMGILMRNEKYEIEGEGVKDHATEAWELELHYELVDMKSDTFEVMPLLDGFVGEEVSGTFAKDGILAVLGYMLLILFAGFVLSRRKWVNSSSWLAVGSTFCIGLALTAAFGLMSAASLPFTLVTNTLAFIMLGIGIDDTFVIMAAMDATDPTAAARDRVSKAVARAGTSILVTSVTDLVAFLAGATSMLPALRNFCLYAGVGIFFDFVLQVTLFVAMIVLDLRRQEKGRADCCCCYTPKNQDIECCGCSCLPATCTDTPESSIAVRVMGDYLPRLILSPAGKATVLILAAGFFCGGVVGMLKVPSDFNIEWFVPDTSFVKDVYELRDNEYDGTEMPIGLYLLGNVDYFTHLDDMRAVTAKLRANDNVDAALVVSWLDVFDSWLPTTTISPPTDTASFTSAVATFIVSPKGRPVSRFLRFNTDGTIRAIEIQAALKDVDGLGGRVDQMDSVRNICDDAPSSLDCRVWSFPFVFVEGQKVIKQETIQNILIAASCVFCVCVLLLANVWMAFLILCMIALVDIELLGMLYAAGLAYNSVSAIFLVLAIGLAVDYSAHIAHAFMVASGTRDERAAKALRELGPSVIYGMTSTFLAVLAMAASFSYVFQTFFKMFSIIVALGGFHGLIVLPVVMSLVGPDGYDRDDEDPVKSKDVPMDTKLPDPPTSSPVAPQFAQQANAMPPNTQSFMPQPLYNMQPSMQPQAQQHPAMQPPQQYNTQAPNMQQPYMQAPQQPYMQAPQQQFHVQAPQQYNMEAAPVGTQQQGTYAYA